MNPSARTDFDLSLYFIADNGIPGKMPLPARIEQAIAGGVTLVQLRAKNLAARDFYFLGREIRTVTRRCHIPLIINDRLDLMLALDADGVHLGRTDLPLEQARQLAPGKIIGYSVNTREHLEQALRGGADYVGIGPVFATITKRDTAPVLGVAALRTLVQQAALPCVAIGGITEANAEAVATTGVTGIAVISALMTAAVPAETAQRLAAVVKKREGNVR